MTLHGWLGQELPRLLDMEAFARRRFPQVAGAARQAANRESQRVAG
jgi:hypothetical protein